MNLQSNWHQSPNYLLVQCDAGFNHQSQELLDIGLHAHHPKSNTDPAIG